MNQIYFRIFSRLALAFRVFAENVRLHYWANDDGPTRVDRDTIHVPSLFIQTSLRRHKLSGFVRVERLHSPSREFVQRVVIVFLAQ